MISMARRANALLLAVCLGGALAAGCEKKSSGNPEKKKRPPIPMEAAPPVVPITTWDAGVRATALLDGQAVIEKHQCTRCHTIDDVKPGARELNCTGCHIFLKGLKPDDRQRKHMVEKYGEPIVARYQRNIEHLMEVPNLTLLARRVRPEWIATFLREPFDLRPAMEDSMIRHKLSEDEITKVVRYFAAKAEAPDPYAPGFKPEALPPRPTDEQMAVGEQLFKTRGCIACHTLGNVVTGVAADRLRAAGKAAMLAPNLRFVRERTRPDALAAWIVNPQKIFPGTLMPGMGISDDDARALAGFLIYADAKLKPLPPPIEPKLPPLIARPVGYEEMKEKVLGKVCVHCHMNDYEKDPGPGNLGGLGFAGIKLQMRTYETLVSGAIDANGKRYSVLEKRPGEAEAPIVAAMLKRRVEEVRDHVQPFDDHERPRYPGGTPGMPMGLPSMSDEAIATLATWIAQGCPGPEKITGLAGVDDGYLVPDGPIKKNKGCELRAPDAKRPAWATVPSPAPSSSK